MVKRSVLHKSIFLNTDPTSHGAFNKEGEGVSLLLLRRMNAKERQLFQLLRAGCMQVFSEEPQLLRSQVPLNLLEQGRLLEASSHTWLKPDSYFNELAIAGRGIRRSCEISSCSRLRYYKKDVLSLYRKLIDRVLTNRLLMLCLKVSQFSRGEATR